MLPKGVRDFPSHWVSCVLFMMQLKQLIYILARAIELKNRDYITYPHPRCVDSTVLFFDGKGHHIPTKSDLCWSMVTWILSLKLTRGFRCV